MTVQKIMNVFTMPTEIKDKAGYLTTLSANDTRQILSQDYIFMSVMQSFFKRLFAQYQSSISLRDGNTNNNVIDLIATKYPTENINPSVGQDFAADLSSSSSPTIINAILAILLWMDATLPPALISSVFSTEILYNYEEAAKFLDSTKTIFKITMDSDFDKFNTISSAAIIGKGDGSEKFQGWPSWAGIDAVVTVIMGSYVRFIPDFATISYSVNRQKMNVMPLGSVSRKGHTAGPRIIAGSLIGVALKNEPLQDVQPALLDDISSLDQRGADATPYREFMLPDQLPDFDILVTIQNEYGHAARISLFGVTITDVGQTTSIQDLQQEIVYQYTATDIDLLSYTGSGGDAQSISLSLDAYRDRRNRINSGKTLHASPFDTPEFWDVWDPASRIIMEPGELKLGADLGFVGQKLIQDLTQKEKEKNVVVAPTKTIANSALSNLEKVPDCENEVGSVYLVQHNAGVFDFTTAPPPKPPALANYIPCVGHGITSADPEWDSNTDYVSPNNLVTTNHSKENQKGAYQGLATKTLVAGNFTYGYAWQTQEYSKSNEILYVEFAEKVLLTGIRIFYMTGTASYNDGSGIHKDLDLLLSHKIIKTITIRYRTNNVWTDWKPYEADLSLDSQLKIADTSSIRNMIELKKLSNATAAGKEEVPYTDAILIKITEIDDHPDKVTAFSFDHTAIAAIVPLGKKEAMVNDLSKVNTYPCKVNLQTVGTAPPSLERRKIGTTYEKIKLKVVSYEGDGSQPYYCPENTVDYYDDTRAKPKIGKIHGWAWQPIGSQTNAWATGITKRTNKMSLILVPDTTKGESASFYMKDITIAKGFLATDYALRDTIYKDLPMYFRTPKKIRIKIYKGSSDPTKTDVENVGVDTALNTQLITNAPNASRSNYASGRAAVLQALSAWEQNKTQGLIFEDEITLGKIAGRTALNAGDNVEESLLNVAKIAERQGFPVVAISIDIVDLWASPYESSRGKDGVDFTGVNIRPDKAPPLYSTYAAISQIYAYRYTNEGVPITNATTATMNIKIATWNVADIIHKRYEDIAKIILAEKLSMIVLTEIQAEGFDGADEANLISALIDASPERDPKLCDHFRAIGTTKGGDRNDNVIIIYDTNIYDNVTHDQFALDEATKRAILYAQFRIKRKDKTKSQTDIFLNVIGCHFVSNIQRPGKPTPVVLRTEQAAFLRNKLDSMGPSVDGATYAIILGDFNATYTTAVNDFSPNQTMAKLIQDDFLDITPKVGSKYQNTWFDKRNPPSYPPAPFDHIIISNKLNNAGPDVEKLEYVSNSAKVNPHDASLSDHSLVHATFKLTTRY